MVISTSCARLLGWMKKWTKLYRDGKWQFYFRTFNWWIVLYKACKCNLNCCCVNDVGRSIFNIHLIIIDHKAKIQSSVAWMQLLRHFSHHSVQLRDLFIFLLPSLVLALWLVRTLCCAMPSWFIANYNQHISLPFSLQFIQLEIKVTFPLYCIEKDNLICWLYWTKKHNERTRHSAKTKLNKSHTRIRRNGRNGAEEWWSCSHGNAHGRWSGAVVGLLSFSTFSLLFNLGLVSMFEAQLIKHRDGFSTSVGVDKWNLLRGQTVQTRFDLNVHIA